jgi:hypothetical protein
MPQRNRRITLGTTRYNLWVRDSNERSTAERTICVEQDGAADPDRLVVKLDGVEAGGLYVEDGRLCLLAFDADGEATDPVRSHVIPKRGG